MPSAARHPFPSHHKHGLSGCDRLGTVLGAENTAANMTSSCALAARFPLKRSHQSIIHQLARCLQTLLGEQWAWRGPSEGSSSYSEAGEPKGPEDGTETEEGPYGNETGPGTGRCLMLKGQRGGQCG